MGVAMQASMGAGLNRQTPDSMSKYTGSQRSLAHSFAARKNLQQEPSLADNMFNSSSVEDFASIQMQQSINRLQSLKIKENLAQDQRQNGLETQLQEAKVVIPELLGKRIPLHWHNFIDDTNQELKQVTSKIYDGGVSKGIKHGQGQMILQSGDIYKGNWKNDLRHGTGLCKFTNGAIYKGEWREGRPQGQGMFFSPPNEIVEGRFDGWKLMDGMVKILFTNGEFYEGNLKDNKRELTGIMHYANGDSFEGEWF